MLGSAYAIKEALDLDEVDGLKDYLSQVVGSDIELETGDKVSVLVGDIRERKGEAFLISRYQILL